MVRQPRAAHEREGSVRPLCVAMLAALAAHAAVLGGAYATRAFRAAPAAARLRERPIDVELALVEKTPEPAAPPAEPERERGPATTRTEPPSRLALRQAPAAPNGEVAAENAAPAESGAVAEAGPVPSAGPPADPRRPIDLGLEGGYMRMALLSGQFERPEAPQKPSDGLLTEGLASLDAAHGTSRSSAVVHAGYEAARELAPSEGLALFDVRADATGAIVSVALVSSGPDEQRWIRVGTRLRDLLSGRRVRVAPGAHGLLTRVRIEHGNVAKTRAELERILGRGAALGQGAGPPRAIAEESTHGSFGPGQLTPTFQVYSSEKSERSLRVIVLSERPL